MFDIDINDAASFDKQTNGGQSEHIKTGES